jgi:hypothetical protein
LSVCDELPLNQVLVSYQALFVGLLLKVVTILLFIYQRHPVNGGGPAGDSYSVIAPDSGGRGGDRGFGGGDGCGGEGAGTDTRSAFRLNGPSGRSATV